MPLTPQEKDELEALRSDLGSPAPAQNGKLTPAEQKELEELRAEPGVVLSEDELRRQKAVEGLSGADLFLANLVDTATFGFGEEIGSRIEGGLNVLEEGARSVVPFDFDLFDTQEQAQQEARDILAASRGTASGIAGQVAGAFSPTGAVGLGAKALGKAAPLVTKTPATTTGRIGQGAGIGAVEAGLTGIGQAEGDLGQRLGEGAEAAATGALVGGTLGRLLGGRQAPRLTPEGQAAKEIGLDLTPGEATDNLKFLKAEERARQTGADFTSGGLRELEAARPSQIDEIARGIIKTDADETVGGAATRGIEALRAEKVAQKQAVRDAYDSASRETGKVAVEAFEPLKQRARASAIETAGFNQELRKQLLGVVEGIENAVPSVPGGRITGVSIAGLEGIRKNLNAAISGFSGPEKAAAKRGAIELKNIYDDWLDDAVEGAFFSGDDKAIDAIKNARALNAQYKSRFGKNPGDPAGRVIDGLVDETVDDAVNKLFGQARIGLSGTGEAMRRIQNASPEAAEAFKQAAWLKIIQKPTGEVKDAGDLANAIRKTFRDAPDVMRTLFDEAERAQINKIATALDGARKRPKAINPSRSGWVLSEFFAKGLFPAGIGFTAFGGVGALAASAPLVFGGVRNLITTQRALNFIGDAPKTRGLIGQTLDAGRDAATASLPSLAGAAGRLAGSATVDAPGIGAQSFPAGPGAQLGSAPASPSLIPSAAAGGLTTGAGPSEFDLMLDALIQPPADDGFRDRIESVGLRSPGTEAVAQELRSVNQPQPGMYAGIMGLALGSPEDDLEGDLQRQALQESIGQAEQGLSGGGGDQGVGPGGDEMALLEALQLGVPVPPQSDDESEEALAQQRFMDALFAAREAVQGAGRVPQAGGF